MDYMDLAVQCPKSAVKFNHSRTDPCSASVSVALYAISRYTGTCYLLHTTWLYITLVWIFFEIIPHQETTMREHLFYWSRVCTGQKLSAFSKRNTLPKKISMIINDLKQFCKSGLKMVSKISQYSTAFWGSSFEVTFRWVNARKT